MLGKQICDAHGAQHTHTYVHGESGNGTGHGFNIFLQKAFVFILTQGMRVPVRRWIKTKLPFSINDIRQTTSIEMYTRSCMVETRS